MRIIVVIAILISSMSFPPAHAVQLNPCQELPLFFPYKAGVQAQKDGQDKEAFDIFCNLSFKGDYRSQFKMAYYFQNGIDNYIDIDPVFALLWAKLSNQTVKSAKRQKVIDQLEDSLTPKQLTKYKKLSYNFMTKIPTGNRIDMQYEPLDLAKLYKEYQQARAPKEYTGSKIKRDKPPLNLSSIQF